MGNAPEDTTREHATLGPETQRERESSQLSAPKPGRKNKTLRRRVLWAFFGVVLLIGSGIGAVFGLDQWVAGAAEDRLFHDLASVPDRSVALVLGTAKHFRGRPNLYYDYRIEAAAELFHANKVRAILVSGDNSRADYDEPSAMRDDLVSAGVPKEYIALDYAGFRTLDSIVRAQEVFGLEDFVIVSQQFHCERALYLASSRSIEAVAYAARDVTGPHQRRVRRREVLARTKAWLDVNILGAEPRFLGEPVHVPLGPAQKPSAEPTRRATTEAAPAEGKQGRD